MLVGRQKSLWRITVYLQSLANVAATLASVVTELDMAEHYQARSFLCVCVRVNSKTCYVHYQIEMSHYVYLPLLKYCRKHTFNTVFSAPP